MKRLLTALLLTLAIAAVATTIATYAAKAERKAWDDCIASGGHIEQVHGPKVGGWACEGGTR